MWKERPVRHSSTLEPVTGILEYLLLKVLQPHLKYGRLVLLEPWKYLSDRCSPGFYNVCHLGTQQGARQVPALQDLAIQ